MLPLFFSGIAFICGRVEEGIACKSDNSHFLLHVLISLNAKYCAGHKSHTVIDNLIIFGRDIYQVR